MQLAKELMTKSIYFKWLVYNKLLEQRHSSQNVGPTR